MENETKLCKHCKTSIPKDAKVCPNCRKKQGGVGKWIIIGVIVVILLAALFGGGDDKPKKVEKCGIKKEKGYLYFLDKKGDISRAKMVNAK